MSNQGICRSPYFPTGGVLNLNLNIGLSPNHFQQVLDVIGWLACWLAGWLVGWLPGWDWVAGWLAGWLLAGWLAG